jgi:hypothetical protein
VGHRTRAGMRGSPCLVSMGATEPAMIVSSNQATAT